jgi:hypothetical protein
VTNTIPLSQLPTASDHARRDQYGRYLIVPPTGGKPMGYTRVTTVAKALDTGGGLASWKATMAVQGLIMRRGLRAQWEALMAEYQSNPWYAGERTKGQCRKLVEECAAVGGANDRKEIGSALHTITALVDLGRNLPHLTEETEADVRAYRNGLAAAGITIVPDQIEVTVVLDNYQVAGTLDRLAVVPGFDLPLIADLKTGANLEYSWQSIAVQLAAYSRANAIYHQGPVPDGSEDSRLPMPAVDQEWGLIFWLNAGTGDLELHLVNLDVGWAAFEHSMWARDWRRTTVNRPLAQPVPTSPGDLEAALEASLARVNQETGELPPPTPSPTTPEREPYEPFPPTSADDARVRAWLQGRIDTIGAHPAARETLGAFWPSGLPTLRGSNDHTTDQLAVIESLLDDVERQYEIPFGPPHPHSPLVNKVIDLFPGSTVVNDKEKPTP